MRRAAAGCFAISVLGGCDITRPADPIDQTDDFTSVHSVLFAGSSEVLVLITRVSSPFSEIDHSVPVSGADVRLGFGGKTWQLAPAADGVDRCTTAEQPTGLAAGCYVATLEQEIQAGATYMLDIVLPNGDTVSGSTTVPATPEIVSPAGRPTFESMWNGTSNEERTPIMLRWRDTSPDALFTLTAGVEQPDCTVNIMADDPLYTVGTPAQEVLGRDHVDLRVHSVRCEPAIAAATHDGFIRVTRYGDELGRYRRSALDLNSHVDELSYGLTGAIGVLTGAASATLPATIIQH